MEKYLWCETEEADEIPTTTVEAWIERLPEICHGYEPQNILNLAELRLFFKALPEEGPVEKKTNSRKVGRNLGNADVAANG